MFKKIKFALTEYSYQDNNKRRLLSNIDTPIDVETLNLKKLHSTLQSCINKKRSAFLIFRKRENKKIEIDNDQINLVLNAIDTLKDLWKGSLNLKAEILFSHQALELLLQSKQIEYLTIIEQKKTQLLEAKHNQKRIKIQTKSLELDNYAKELLAKAQYETAKAKNDSEKAKASILLKAAKAFEKMPYSTQTKIVASISGLPLDHLEEITEAIQLEIARKQKLENDHTEYKINEIQKKRDNV